MDEYYYDEFELNDDPFDELPDDEFNFYPNFLKNPSGELDQTLDENEVFHQSSSTNSFQTRQRKPLQEIQNNQKKLNSNKSVASPYFLANSTDFYDFHDTDKFTAQPKQKQHDPTQSTQSNIIQKHNEISSLANVSDKLKNLVPVTELPARYQNIFSQFPYFNTVQSTVFKDVVYCNNNMVISAPTSSGKTVILELAIIRLLTTLNYNKSNPQKFKVVYMAPLKALCNEKFNEWQEKFEKLHNLKCIQLTGDTEFETEKDFKMIENVNIICTTPEKWDVMTRKWKHKQSILNAVKLFLIDEIHVLGENSRGATIEAVVSRMKTFIYRGVDGYQTGASLDDEESTSMLRFIAISATIPNINDLASWLGSGCKSPSIVYKLDEGYRPVKVNKIVIGVYSPPEQNDYMFENNLAYKLGRVIENYSNNKPTLIFCSTRKSTVVSAGVLAKERNYIINRDHQKCLLEVATRLKDSKLRDLVVKVGIGYHHAGMDMNDRSLIESLFLKGNLLVLISTSTLAIGINLPAHLVIVKSTKYYQNNTYTDYSISQILQMVGRAGRPQFDKTANAVVMTKQSDKVKYENLIIGKEEIESHLHKNLIEHLNAEICLGTIINLETAINWLKSTFLFARIKKNPRHYNLSEELKYKMANKVVAASNSLSFIDECLIEILTKNLTDLHEFTLINSCDFDNPRAQISPTNNGQLMARYCIAFETMKLVILNLNPRFSCEMSELDVAARNNSGVTKSLEELLKLVSASKELEDIQLRASEKAVLNALNNDGKIPKTKAGEESLELKRDKQVVRFIQPGKIKTREMKINTLIQTQLGCVSMADGKGNTMGLSNETYHIFRVALRVSNCLIDYVVQSGHKNYETYINGLILSKCLYTKLWYNSDHIFKQFSSIGDTISKLLVKANVTSFDKLLEMNPRKIELITNKNPPFGIRLIETVRNLPQFMIEFEQVQVQVNNNKSMADFCTVDIHCRLINIEHISQNMDSNNDRFLPVFNFVLGDGHNNLLFSTRLNNKELFRLNGVWTKRIHLNLRDNSDVIFASLISKQFVGLDVHEQFQAFNEASKINEVQLRAKRQVENEHDEMRNEKSLDDIFTEPKMKKNEHVYALDEEDDDEELLKLDLSPVKTESPRPKKRVKFNHSSPISSIDENISFKEPASNERTFRNSSRKFIFRKNSDKEKLDFKQSKINAFFTPKFNQHDNKKSSANEQQQRNLDSSASLSSLRLSGQNSSDSSSENSSYPSKLHTQEKKAVPAIVVPKMNNTFTSCPESLKFKGSSITVNKMKPINGSGPNNLGDDANSESADKSEWYNTVVKSPHVIQDRIKRFEYDSNKSKFKFKNYDEPDNIENLFSESDLKSPEIQHPRRNSSNTNNRPRTEEPRRFKNYDEPDDIQSLFSESDLKSPEHGSRKNSSHHQPTMDEPIYLSEIRKGISSTPDFAPNKRFRADSNNETDSSLYVDYSDRGFKDQNSKQSSNVSYNMDKENTSNSQVKKDSFRIFSADQIIPSENLGDDLINPNVFYDRKSTLQRPKDFHNIKPKNANLLARLSGIYNFCD